MQGILEQQYGGIVDDDFIALLSADHSEVLREGELGDEMVSVEDRLITASLNSYTGKDKANVDALFHKLAVFPEDVPVPVGVFDVLAPLWAGRETKRAHLKVRSWITALIHCSLANGSIASGVYQHDVSVLVRAFDPSRLSLTWVMHLRAQIVRHFAITRHSDEQLRALQQAVVDELLAARPTGGFPDLAHAQKGSLEEYVASNLWWHVRGSMGDGPPSKTLVDHEDDTIIHSVALAMGKDRIHETVSAWERDGDQLGAAKLCWAGHMLGVLGLISTDETANFLFRAVPLLEACASDETRNFELLVLNKAYCYPGGGDRHAKAMKRLQDMSAAEKTFESKCGEAMGVCFNAFAVTGMLGGENSTWPKPTWEMLEQGLDLYIGANKIFKEGIDLADTKMQKDLGLLVIFHCIDYMPFMSHYTKWDPEEYGGEPALVAAIRSYDFEVDGQFHKTNLIKADYFRCGCFTHMLTLHYGNLECLRLWCTKTVAAFQQIGLAKTHDYAAEWCEIMYAFPTGYMLLLAGEQTGLSDLVAAIGFGWDGVGFDKFIPTVSQWTTRNGNATKEGLKVFSKLLIYLSSPDGEIDSAEVSAWMPSPQDLAKEDKTFYMYSFYIWNTLALGARAFERLKRDDDAAAAAQLGIDLHRKKFVVADCHCVLGRVLARRGDLAGAELAFRSAIKVAQEARLPLLELIAGRELRKHVASAASDGEATIDTACARMKKERAQFASLLA